MRQICYGVAMSLDGYIAGPNGECDWILMDPDIDFAEIFARFDTLLMGRRTFRDALQRGGFGFMPAMKILVVSRTLRPRDYPEVTIISDNLHDTVSRLRAEPGKDIWLFGGGALFQDLLDARLVDRLEVAVMPVLLGGGIPMLPPPAKRARMRLTDNCAYRTGILRLEYSIEYEPA